MKFKEETRWRLVDRTVDGVTHQVRQRYTEPVPVLPRDWDQVAIRGAAALILALTGIAITWSTISIGALLGGGVGYAAAALFDVSWLTVLVLEWLARFHPGKRRFPRALGWLLVALAAGAIFWHGADEGSWGLAVVGAAVSVVSKLLWLALFRHIDRELTAEDQEWVRLELSAANAKLALASVRRQVARSEVHAAAELLAAERVRAAFPQGMPTDLSNNVQEVPAGEPAAVGSTGEHDANTGPEPGPNTGLNRANTVHALPAPSIAELAREQITAGAQDRDAVTAILCALPGANADSVAATVRRERRKANRGYL